MINTDAIKKRIKLSQWIGRKTRLQEKRKGVYKGLCPFHEEKTPSFEVDDNKQTYFCFGCKAGGDVFSFTMYSEDTDFPGAAKLLAEHYQIAIEEIEDPTPKPKKHREYQIRSQAPKRKEPSVEPPTDQEKQARIHTLISECGDRRALQVGQNYLISRGLAPELPPGIVWHPWLYHTEANRCFPAMIGPLFAGTPCSTPLGIQRVYLDPTGSGKARVGEGKMVKKGLGKFKGGACWLINQHEFGFWPFVEGEEMGELWICEGLETGISLYQFLDRWQGGHRAWAVASAISANNLHNLCIPPGINRVVIAADKDISEVGQKAAALAAQVYRDQDLQVEIKLPPLPIPQGQKSVDWLDAVVRIRGGRW